VAEFLGQQVRPLPSKDNINKLRGKQNSNLQSQIPSTTDCRTNGNCILYSTNSHGLVLCPSHVSENVGINQKGVIKNDIPIIFTHFICCDMYMSQQIMLSDNCHLSLPVSTTFDAE